MTKKLPSNYYVVVDSPSERVMLHKPLACNPGRYDSFDLHVKGEHLRSVNILSHDSKVIRLSPMAYDHVLANGKYCIGTVPVGSVLVWHGTDYYPEYSRRHKDFNWVLYQDTIDKILKRHGAKE